MEIRDKLISFVRTLWPALIAYVVTLVLAVTEPLGIDLDSATATLGVGWVVTTLVYLAGRWLEGRTGMSVPARLARFAAAILLGSTAQPVYAGKVIDGQAVVQR